MKICVFGAASNEIDKQYIDRVEEVCKALGERGHELVFGAGANGLMGAAARGMKAGGGKITGVIPEFFRAETIEEIYSECDELIFTETMQERKKTMEDHADAFIVVPGGIGTFEEMFEVLTLKQLGRHSKPIVFYNIAGYYNNLMAFMHHCSDEGFIRRNCHLLYNVTDNNDELIDYIENSKPLNFSVSDLKHS
ncbi:MAG TPA: TIGR00730 family Rossman fold protein [Candidatus Ornithomonoglobus merdipullorum]|uniref:Cytokinin riboside 5'-monophosphate phosphoribohydrolase n=1 Tax=Candidatus Ornithomonoglobus merdipullorum TaxID=2840895 RepID=A0A9D1MCJ2_9FIRM|nr:TIGR00730 family Rossman fold protein [Candidatus Ornithomonoglobus merdipullorum]